MGGLAGFVGIGADDKAHVLRALLRSEGPTTVNEVSMFTATRGVALGAVARSRMHLDAAYDDSKRVGIAVYGLPHIASDHTSRATADRLIKGYVEGGKAWFSALDGSFVIALVDDVEHRVLLVNDRTATIPLRYARTDHAVAFGPSSRTTLALLQRRPEVDTVGALQFLSAGRQFADRTLYEGVKLMGPAAMIEISTDTRSLNEDRYWKLSFGGGRKRRSKRSATHELYEIFLRSFQRQMPEESVAPRLLLSGGYDSRVLLAMSVAAGRQPSEAITYGTSDDIPDSDPAIAQLISSMLGVRHRFLQYDESGFQTHWRDWMQLSELMSDNLGSFAAGPEFLTQTGQLEAPVLIGDHALGSAGIPVDRRDAIETATKLPLDGLPRALGEIINDASRERAEEELWSDVYGIADDGDDTHPKDLKDRLSYRLGLCRWLNAPTFFREPCALPLRPFLSHEALQFYASLPPHLRIDKLLMVNLLKSRFPDLARVPVASSGALIDWDRYFWRMGRVRQLAEDEDAFAVIAASPLAEFLDVDRAHEAWVAALASGPRAGNVKPASSLMSVTAFRRALSQNSFIGAYARRAQIGARALTGRTPNLSRWKLMLRLLLLSRFVSLMARGAEDDIVGLDSREPAAMDWSRDRG